jgi:hypothetical protein
MSAQVSRGSHGREKIPRPKLSVIELQLLREDALSIERYDNLSSFLFGTGSRNQILGRQELQSP